MNVDVYMYIPSQSVGKNSRPSPLSAPERSK